MPVRERTHRLCTDYSKADSLARRSCCLRCIAAPAAQAATAQYPDLKTLTAA